MNVFQACRRRRFLLLLLLLVPVFFLMGAKAKKSGASAKKPKKSAAGDARAPAKDPPRLRGMKQPPGRPWYERMVADGLLRIAVFWGWDHPREVIEAAFPAFELLDGKTIYFQGKAARIQIAMITQVADDPKALFKAALENPAIDAVIYSGHARYGGGMAFNDRDDIFRSGNGEQIEDRHTTPFRYFKATREDLDATTFPQTYRIVMLNCCDSEGHFRQSWGQRISDCGAPIDLVTVEYPVFNLYDHRRVLNFIQDLMQFADWKTIKAHYDSEVHKRTNRLVVDPVYVPEEAAASAPETDADADAEETVSAP